uniref:Uncharacterized protein n=1 Tax=Rhizophora mucronata TaxID=61149 RepID=A0A2P2MIC7_RHIMU
MLSGHLTVSQQLDR